MATSLAQGGVGHAPRVRRLPKTKAQKRAKQGKQDVPKLSRKTLARRRREYAVKYLPFVEKVARGLGKRLPQHIQFDDLVSSGVIGVMESAERFDPKRVDRFEAFATARIRGAMLDGLRANDTLSRDMRSLSKELREATRRLETRFGRTATQAEVAAELGLGLDEFYQRQKSLSGSLVISTEDLSPVFLERVVDERSATPFEVAAHREMLARLVASIDELPERLQQVLSLYYCEDLNLREIGETLGVTESRACQLHGQATRRLRESMSRCVDPGDA